MYPILFLTEMFLILFVGKLSGAPLPALTNAQYASTAALSPSSTAALSPAPAAPGAFAAASASRR